MRSQSTCVGNAKRKKNVNVKKFETRMHYPFFSSNNAYRNDKWPEHCSVSKCCVIFIIIAPSEIRANRQKGHLNRNANFSATGKVFEIQLPSGAGTGVYGINAVILDACAFLISFFFKYF